MLWGRDWVSLLLLLLVSSSRGALSLCGGGTPLCGCIAFQLPHLSLTVLFDFCYNLVFHLYIILYYTDKKKKKKKKGLYGDYASVADVINPRRACAARVTIVVLCVCVCVRGPHLQLAQLSDKVGILAVSVSCSLVFKKGVFRTIAFWRS